MSSSIVFTYIYIYISLTMFGCTVMVLLQQIDRCGSMHTTYSTLDGYNCDMAYCRCRHCTGPPTLTVPCGDGNGLLTGDMPV